MKKYIDADKLIERASFVDCDGEAYGSVSVEMIEEMPAANVAPVISAFWQKSGFSLPSDLYSRV